MNKTIIIVILILIVGLVGYLFLNNRSQGPALNIDQNVNVNQNQSASTTATTGKVIIKNFAFDPGNLTVKAGETVTWTNEDSSPHQIKSDTFNSGNLNTGNSFQFKFENRGTYDYFCSIHPSMKGKIIVE